MSEGKEVSLVQGNGPGPDGENDFKLSEKNAPIMYKLPSKKDLQQLMKFAGETQKEQADFLKLKSGFNCQDKLDPNFRGYTQQHKK